MSACIHVVDLTELDAVQRHVVVHHDAAHDRDRRSSLQDDVHARADLDAGIGVFVTSSAPVTETWTSWASVVAVFFPNTPRRGVRSWTAGRAPSGSRSPIRLSGTPRTFVPVAAPGRGDRTLG